MGFMVDIICTICGKLQQVKILYPATFKLRNVSKSTYSARRFPDKIHYRILRSDLFPKNSFDLILCFHTLDHMIDPNKFIKGAYGLLKKNGYVIVVVHDTEGLSVKLFQERSAIFDIEHIYLFNKKTLSEIFRRNKFKVIKVFNLVNNYSLNYWIAMSGFPHVIKKSANFIANMLKINKIGFSIPAGNIGVIAKKNSSFAKA